MKKPTFLILAALAGLFLPGCGAVPTPTAATNNRYLSEVTDRLPIHYGFALERVISWTTK